LMAGTMLKQPVLKSCHLVSAIWLSNFRDLVARKKTGTDSSCRFFYARR
jgi:hypothetical protein